MDKRFPRAGVARRLLRAACIAAAPALSASTLAAPPAEPCPPGLPAATRCSLIHDQSGAWVWMAMPARWNRVLVVHAHGGPELGEPDARRGAEDLKRWSLLVEGGYAWVASTYRSGGYGVRMAAEDTVRARELFVHAYGPPPRVVLHGQSWGANVAAKTAELFPADEKGRPLWDALLLTSGVLGGGTRSYDVRLDLRVVYQALCHNHPLPGEPDYPLWKGLPADSPLTRAELAHRMDECLGLSTPPAQRSEAQQHRLKELLQVTTIPERTLASHMNWATWLFRDLVQKRLGGRNPFGNEHVRYHGSDDDEALNASVARYRPDPQAVAELAEDSDLTGRTRLPTLTLHAIDDPTAFVELESVYREAREKAGTADRLVQVFSDEHEHSFLSGPEYLAALQALLGWVDEGRKPDPQRVLQLCRQRAPQAACLLEPGYRPRPLAARVPPR